MTETERTGLTDLEVKVVVDRAVRQTLITLGLDISTADKMLQAQADFGYLRKQRLGSEEVTKWVKRTAVGACVSGAIYAFWHGFKAAMTAKGVLP